MARFQKGQSGNPKGRPKGAGNVIPSMAKDKLAGFVLDKIDHLDEIWQQLEPKDQAKFLASVISYVIPKQTAIIEEEERDFKVVIHCVDKEGNEVPYERN